MTGCELFDHIMERGSYAEKDPSHLWGRSSGLSPNCLGIVHRYFKVLSTVPLHRARPGPHPILMLGLRQADPSCSPKTSSVRPFLRTQRS